MPIGKGYKSDELKISPKKSPLVMNAIGKNEQPATNQPIDTTVKNMGRSKDPFSNVSSKGKDNVRTTGGL